MTNELEQLTFESDNLKISKANDDTEAGIVNSSKKVA